MITLTVWLIGVTMTLGGFALGVSLFVLQEHSSPYAVGLPTACARRPMR